ncbi:hypothetical protein [Planktothricoides raciborskii]|uniref:Uncharacterized protein n=2 Tax=Planktothricoides raciborskii TaxID=132608 RepID=A0AAU8JIH2_9CYAN|nr:hypothetical protein [Planktothricoides raciborskii]MBD2546296.1 hypothetical protein [Planktothricoides raciborskii FACHB-1370]MBD2584203.1 hypothetical protein [Planktothricoides raciborskii FACHB-1261]
MLATDGLIDGVINLAADGLIYGVINLATDDQEGKNGDEFYQCRGAKHSRLHPVDKSLKFMRECFAQRTRHCRVLTLADLCQQITQKSR